MGSHAVSCPRQGRSPDRERPVFPGPHRLPEGELPPLPVSLLQLYCSVLRSGVCTGIRVDHSISSPPGSPGLSTHLPRVSPPAARRLRAQLSVRRWPAWAQQAQEECVFWWWRRRRRRVRVSDRVLKKTCLENRVSIALWSCACEPTLTTACRHNKFGPVTASKTF